jgi:hypothetical protein
MNTMMEECNLDGRPDSRWSPQTARRCEVIMPGGITASWTDLKRPLHEPLEHAGRSEGSISAGSEVADEKPF